MTIAANIPNLFSTLNAVASSNEMKELLKTQTEQEKKVALQKTYQPIYLKHLFTLLMTRVKTQMKQNASKVRTGYTIEVEITTEELVDCFPQKVRKVFEYSSEFAQAVREEFMAQGFDNQKVKIIKFAGKTGEKRVFQITL